jgi:3-oxosteroid 1-dehydrogenase
VLLATGGYDWNPNLVRYFEQMPEVHSAAPPQIEGDHLVMACELGAAIAALPLQTLAIMFGRHVPGEEAEEKPLWRNCSQGGYPHAMLVNRHGRRFCDESFYREYHPKMHIWDGLKQEYRNYPVYLIFDQNYRNKYPLGTYLPEQDIPEEVAKQADTIRALALKLEIDPDGLELEVARFNGFCVDGVDRDFGKGSYPWANFMIGDLRNRPNPNMGPIEKPPFYGTRLVMNLVGINSAGLRTNANAQVMHVRDRPIPGLYAAGNSSALLDTGAGYQSGIACTRGMLWGYVAAKHSAGKPITRVSSL